MTVSSSRNRPSLEQLIAGDPRFAAEVAAIQIEAIEEDRYQRQHSFVCRHFGWCTGLSMFMIYAPAIAIVVLSGSIDWGSPSGRSLMLKLLITVAAGIALTLFCFARKGSKNWATAWGVVILVLAVASALILAMMAVCDVVISHLPA